MQRPQAIREFIERRCYSRRQQSYARFAGADELDASVLLGLLSGYGDGAVAAMAQHGRCRTA